MMEWYLHGRVHRNDAPLLDPYYFEGYLISPEMMSKIKHRRLLHEAHIKQFILDRILNLIYDPRRKSGRRRLEQNAI